MLANIVTNNVFIGLLEVLCCLKREKVLPILVAYSTTSL